jgi:hypothetical protein
VLAHLGIFGLLGKSVRTKIANQRVKHWVHATGTEVVGAAAAPAVRYYHGAVPAKFRTTALYDGLVEAMTNATGHAYPDLPPSSGDRRWWMFTQILNEQLTISLCDLGIGIPRSFADTWRKQVRPILAMLGFGQSDADHIRAALTLGRSATGLKYRGKGLREMRAVLDQRRGGRMMVLSGKGHVSLSSRTDLKSHGDFSDAIPGTLIEWTIPLDEEAANG